MWPRLTDNFPANLKDRAPQGVEHELRKLYFDTAKANHPAILDALRNTVPTSQIVYGSDVPVQKYSLTNPGLEAYKGFSAADRKAIDHVEMPSGCSRASKRETGRFRQRHLVSVSERFLFEFPLPVLELTPHSMAARNFLRTALFRMGNLEGAIEQGKVLSRLDPTFERCDQEIVEWKAIQKQMTPANASPAFLFPNALLC